MRGFRTKSDLVFDGVHIWFTNESDDSVSKLCAGPAPIDVNPTFGAMGAELVAQSLEEPCIADGDLSDCSPAVGLLVTGLGGG